jgi:hypothetical protein
MFLLQFLLFVVETTTLAFADVRPEAARRRLTDLLVEKSMAWQLILIKSTFLIIWSITIQIVNGTVEISMFLGINVPTID